MQTDKTDYRQELQTFAGKIAEIPADSGHKPSCNRIGFGVRTVFCDKSRSCGYIVGHGDQEDEPPDEVPSQGKGNIFPKEL